MKKKAKKKIANETNSPVKGKPKKEFPIKYIWLLVLGLALASRALYLWQLGDLDFFHYPVGDGAAYVSKAVGIANGNWLGREVFYQSPFYPYFLAVIFKLIGQNLTVVRIIQAMLGACGCLFIGLAARNFFSRRIGIIAGFLSAVYPVAIFFDGLIQKTTADFFLSALLLLVLSQATKARGWGFFLTGLCIGLLTLNRDNALVYLPVLLIYIWIKWRVDSWRSRLAFSLKLLGGVILILGPVCCRNWLVGDTFAVTAQFGPNFYIGNNPAANGAYQPLRWGRGDATFEKTDATEIAEKSMGPELTPGQVSSFWFNRALDFIWQQPGEWLRLLLIKSGLVWQSAELSDSDSLLVYLDALPWLDVLYHAFPFGVLVPLAFLGLIVSWRTYKASRLFFAMVGALFASVAAFYMMARYRFVLVPLLLPLAAAFCAQVVSLFKEKKTKYLIFLAVVGVLSSILVRQSLIAIDGNIERSVAYYNLAITQSRSGELAKARENFQRSLSYSPGDPNILMSLAQLLSRQGRDQEALPHALAALDATDAPEARMMLKEWGNILLGQRNPAVAIPLFRKLLQKEPQDAGLLTQLAQALLLTGQSAEAEGCLRQALAVNPQFSPALKVMAVIESMKSYQPKD